MAEAKPGKRSSLSAENTVMHDPRADGDAREDPQWRKLMGLPPLAGASKKEQAARKAPGKPGVR